MEKTRRRRALFGGDMCVSLTPRSRLREVLSGLTSLSVTTLSSIMSSSPSRTTPNGLFHGSKSQYYVPKHIECTHFRHAFPLVLSSSLRGAHLFHGLFI